MVVDPTSSRVVVVQDLYGRYLGYSEDKGVHFSSNCHKLILRRTEVGVVLALRENPELVLIQHKGSVLVERNPFDLTNASIVLYCNLQRCTTIHLSSSIVYWFVTIALLFVAYAIQFSSANSFIANSHGTCIASDEPLSIRKTSKLFKLEVVLECSPMKWPTRINLQGTSSKLYLENSSGLVMRAAAAKCCTEEFILEIPSVHASSDPHWKGCVWYGDGTHVMTANQTYSSMSLTPQHTCFGREEFIHTYEGKNTLSFCTLEGKNRVKVSIENEKKFLMEICPKPCAIVSVYGDVLFPLVFDGQVASNRVNTVHISAQNTQKMQSICSSWIFRHHGDCIYSIECSETRQNLILSQLGCLAFSVNQEERYPNQIALFEVEMVCRRLERAYTIGGGNANVTGFRISCVQKYNGRKMTLNALPDGSIRLLECSKAPCPDEIFTITDSTTAKNSAYLKGTLFDPHKEVMRKAKSQMVLGSQINNPRVRPSQSCDNIAAKYREEPLVQEDKWGVISAASAEMYLESFIADFISKHYDLQSPADVQMILKDLLPLQYTHCLEFTVLNNLLSKQYAMNASDRKSSKVCCADMAMTASLDEEGQGIKQLISALDDEEKREAFFCTACKGDTGLLKPLHPEINPQHHLYLKTMLRLQFGGTRTRRGLPTAHQSNRPGSTLLRKCIFLGACAFMAYKKATSP